ncbi:hypothetical protein RJ55_08313 [Drechmeria coniospora]|nr:hypothetical protein RJ55_08313 [Drechmeria coniospora]
MPALNEATPGTALDIRVEDFLDDKLHEAADLDTLDQLLVNVETQRNQLQSQLDDAAKQLEQARHTALDRQGSLQARMDEFHKLQESIDVRVQVAAASDAPSEAIARLQEPMKKLQAVELAQKYLSLLQMVERLRADARSHLPESPKAALEPYAQLKELTIRLKGVPGSGELHLVGHVETVTEMLWKEMKKTMSAELDAVLAKRHWPRVDPETEMDEEWMSCFEKLLDLQMPEIVHNTGLVSLLPFDVMASIFVSEFRFHFLSDKPTSSLQAIGTHCFPWFLATIEKWEAFFRDNLGPLLATKFGNTPVADKMVYLDPVCALITCMMPVMKEKIHATTSEATANPPFLSGFMSQVMTLDDDVRQRFNYDGGDVENGWAGLTADVLDIHFDAWFRVERDFAMEHFEKTVESHDARKIDYNYAVDGKMKPTFAAVRITDLLRTVTTKYERLRKLKHKSRFLTGIQLDILDGYHDRLRGSLEAYQAMTSTLGRTLHGASKEQLAALEGTGVLETLCKVIGSADHVANTLAEWSDEEFFVVLWEDLHAQDEGRKHQAVHDDPPPEADEMRGHGQNRFEAGGDDGGIFDETAAAYQMRRKAAEELLVGALVESHTKAFRTYLHHVQWTTVGETAVLDDPSQLSITPELDEPLRVLKRNLDFLSKALSTASLRRVWHDTLDKLQDMLWNGVLLKQSFTTLGAAQFAHDGAAIFSLVDRYVSGGSTALDALREGMQLLCLPPSTEPSGVLPDGASAISLKEASDRAFTSNDEARKVLEELGLDALTPLNARYILQRRVENNENIGW